VTRPVVGLDLSLARTGMALTDGRLVSIRPKAGADDRGRRLHQIVSDITAWLTASRIPPSLAVIERYSPGGIQGLTASHIGELGGVVRLRLFELAIPWIEVPPAALKKYATGSGGASKEMMTAAAEVAGADPNNHDEADAFWLRRYGLEMAP